MNPIETKTGNRAEREEPMFCAVLAARPPEFERPAELREPVDFARAVVIELFARNGMDLERMVDPRTLRVIIGEGNWISFECDFWPAIRGSAEALAPGFHEPVRSRILKLNKSLERKVWFRTAGQPSLHYFIEKKNDVLRIRGHVDAAAPRRHPLRHLLQDYMPAHGVGTHPTAQQLWERLVSSAKQRA
jgi:hypothetical protein